MVSDRGTDPATERRRLRPREENDAVGSVLEDAFDAIAEVGLFGLPTLVIAVFAAPYRTKTAVAAGTIALCLAVATLRSDRLAVGPEWPPTTLGLSALRLAYYNLAIALMVVVEQGVTVAGELLFPDVGAALGGTLLTAIAAAGAVTVALAAAALFPGIALAAARRTPSALTVSRRSP